MRISIYQSFFRACLYSIHDIVVRRKRIKASSTCKSSFTSSQLHAFLSTKHQHPDYSIYTKLIQTSSTFSIRSDKQTHQWIGNKFNKGDVGKSSVLAAATSLFLEAFVPVTRSRTKDRTHPAASLAGGTRDIPTTRYQKSANTQPTSIISSAPPAKYQPHSDRVPATIYVVPHVLTMPTSKVGDVTSLMVTRIFVEDAGHILLPARSIIMQRIHRGIVPVVRSVMSGASIS